MDRRPEATTYYFNRDEAEHIYHPEEFDDRDVWVTKIDYDKLVSHCELLEREIEHLSKPRKDPIEELEGIIV